MTMLETGETAPDLLLPDHNGNDTHLADLWAERPLLLLFVRHLGCVFCRELLVEARDAQPSIASAGGSVAAVTMGTVEQAAALRQRLGLAFPLLADPNQDAYRAFGAPRGGWWKVAGSAMWVRGLPALVKGGMGRPRGDLRQLQAVFLIDREGTIRFTFEPKSSADHPAMRELIGRIETLSAVAASP